MDNLIQSSLNKIKKFVQTNIPSAIQSVKQQVQNTSLLELNPFTAKVSKLYKQVAPQIQQPTIKNTIEPYVQNRIINPISTGIKQLGQISPNIKQGKYVPALGNLAQGSFNVIGGAASVNPAFGVPYAGYDALKAQGASRIRGASIPKSLEEARKGFTGEKQVGLGSALSTNPIIEKAGNIAEIVAPLALMGYNLFKSVKNISQYSKLTPEERLAYQEAQMSYSAKATTKAPVDLLVSHEGVERKTVDLYKNKILNGEKIDPIIIVNEGAKYGVEDGKHRLQAYKELGFTDVPIIFKGGHEYKKMMTMESNIKVPKGDFEQALEQNTGWKPGLKEKFDQAFMTKDVKTVKKLLPDIPEDYKASFADEIDNLLKAPEGKIPVINGKIKVKGIPGEINVPEMKLNKVKAAEKLPEIMSEKPYPWSVWDKNLKRFVDPTVPGEVLPKMEQFTNAQLKQEAGRVKYNAEIKSGTFKEIFGDWFGKRKAAETTALAEVKNFKVPKGINGEEVIRYIENPDMKVSPETEKYTSQIRTKFDELYTLAKKEGIDMEYMKNYITHVWDKSPEEVAALYKTAGQQFGFAKQRGFPTYEEGIAMGLKPKYTDPQQILAQYVNNLEKTKANIDFIKSLKAEGLIIPKRMPGFEPIAAPGFPAPSIKLGDGTIREGAYYAPREIAQSINKVFSEQKSAFNFPAKVSGKLQDITLSGGGPRTPINAWTSAQTLKEVMAGRVKGPLKALWTSFSEGGSNKYFTENSQFIKEQQLNNIPISTSYDINSLAPKSFVEKVFGKNLGDFWSKTVNEPTFKRFMPILQTEFYKDVKKSALNSGLIESEAINIASKATKNWYGLTSTADTALKSQLGKDVTTTFLFAPKYRESMINFWVNNLKSLKNPLALENRTNVKFIIGSIITAITYDQLNRKFNNGRSMVDNPPGTEDKLLIPTGNGNYIGVPFLSSIATVPRGMIRQAGMLAKGNVSGAVKDAGQTYLSSMFKPIADVAANSDYFGKSITEEGQTTGEKYKAMGNYLKTQYVSHPYLRELFDARNSKDPAYQRLSRVAELPLRFYTQKTLDTKYYFGARDKSLAGLDTQEQQAFNAIPKSDTNDPNTRILKYQIYLTYPKVFEAKQLIELETAAKTNKSIDPIYLVNYDTAKKYMRYESLPEGSQDRKDMIKAFPELTALFDIRNKYFAENPIPGQTGTQRPMPSTYVQGQMDMKNWSDPQVKAYLDANTAWNNTQREKLGLPPLAGFGAWPKAAKKVARVSKGTVRKAKAGKSFKVKAIKSPKIKTLSKKAFKVKAKKQPKIKVKMPKLPKFG